jgi:uncharacterized protein YndB with AHSA1/START domain
MEQPTVDIVREFDLPRVIVWDALVDPELVSGWLAQADIEPVAGGIYNLVWTHRPMYADTFGRIVLLQHPERLHIDSTNLGRIEFTLESVDGGFRGTGTRLRATIDLAAADLPAADVRADAVDDAARVTADWVLNLEQLEELLHGRPVDWRTWSQRSAIDPDPQAEVAN